MNLRPKDVLFKFECSFFSYILIYIPQRHQSPEISFDNLKYLKGNIIPF